MKGIATMTPADFQSEFAANHNLTATARPTLHLIHADCPESQGKVGNPTSQASVTRQSSGFLNQSMDEIARLYCESPFSW